MAIAGDDANPARQGKDPYAALREAMVREQIRARGITDPRVLHAMGSVPREIFVPPALQAHAYEDRPLRLGDNQTISQPFIVATMSAALGIQAGSRVLEIGTGSGYQAAILATMGARVYSVEIQPVIETRADQLLDRLGVKRLIQSGYAGLPAQAPFDRILATAAPTLIPPAWYEQLVPGGVLLAPLGATEQVLRRIVRSSQGLQTEDLMAVRFVPLREAGSGDK